MKKYHMRLHVISDVQNLPRIDIAVAHVLDCAFRILPGRVPPIWFLVWLLGFSRYNIIVPIHR